jgi:hypothetical protein
LPTATYDQTLRVDGVHQQEVNIVNPAFPIPEVLTTCRQPTATSGSEFRAPQTTRFSAGIEHSESWCASSRPTAINADRICLAAEPQPIDQRRPQRSGVREHRRGRVGCASRQHQLQIDANVNPGAVARVQRAARQLEAGHGVYQLHAGDDQNNTDGPFVLPATGDLAAEWGPAATDVRAGELHVQ